MKLYNKLYIALILALTVSACKVSKDIPRPADAAPEQFRNAVATADTLSIASLPYKEFFKEEAIRQLIDTAIKNNYDMQIALKNIEAANLLFRQSKLGNLPTLNLQVTSQLNRPSDNSLTGIQLNQFANSSHVEDYTVAAGLSWEADIWGKIASQKRAAGAVYLQSEEARKAIQTRLVAAVAQRFYELIMLDTQLDIAKRNLALNDSTKRMIKMQFDAGQVTFLAVQQAEAQQLLAAGLIPQLEQQINLQENALSILTGAFPKAIARTGLLNALKVQDQQGTGIPSVMVSLRPDVKNAELELLRANANVGITKSSMYPSLNITASGGLNSFKANNWFTIPGALFGIVGGGITQPLFQRRQLRTQYDVAMLNREKSVLQFRQSVLNAVAEVSDELIKLEKLKQKHAIAETRVIVIQQALRNANLLFTSGMANYLEVITAQANALQSQLDLATVKTDQLNASVELYRALGGGWK